MSTGLTWVVLYDVDGIQSPFGGTSLAFSNYDEAVNWALWNARYIYDQIYAANVMRFAIYTTSPNPNGYVNVGGSPSFTQFD